MTRDRFNPHNTINLILVLAGLTVLLGFFIPTHWRTWIHWGWLGIVGHFAAMAVAVFFVWGLSFGAAESMMKGTHGKEIKRSRQASYGLCVMSILCFAVLFGCVASAGASAGDYIEATGETVTQDVAPWPVHKRDRLIEDTFFVSLLPALFGVRCALGPKPKE
jgi:hypothetical protein